MITYFLGDEEVSAYAVDLAGRLEALGENFPAVWCPLGISGEKMAEVLGEKLKPEFQERLRFVRLSSDRDSGATTWLDDIRAEDLTGPVLLLDSALHSGRSMRLAVEALRTAGAREIITYSLVIKRGAELVPNFFSLLIGDRDRAYFQLDSIPNNRLQKEPPFGTLRTLRQDDVHRKFPDTGLGSMDKASFADLYYEVMSRNSHVYVYEHDDALCGYVSFEIKDRVLFVDGVGADKSYQGKNVGGLLLRWAETYARASGCDAVELWAIAERVSFYEHLKFEDLGKTLDLGDETYRLMRRRILYNVRPDVG